jgi:hypothetical protein
METAALENRKPHARSCVTNGNELFATKEPVDGRSMASRRFRDSGPIGKLSTLSKKVHVIPERPPCVARQGTSREIADLDMENLFQYGE